VNPEPVTKTGTSGGGLERDEPPVGQPHDAAAGHGEHEIIGALAVDTRRQLDGGNRGSGTVRDWCDFGVPRTTRPPTSEKARRTSMRQHRIERGMSQKDLATAAGVDVRQIRRYEAGEQQRYYPWPSPTPWASQSQSWVAR